MVDQIGVTAGDIWRHLERNQEASLTELKTNLRQTPAVIQMAVGWLAREGKVKLSKKGAGYLVRLTAQV